MRRRRQLDIGRNHRRRTQVTARIGLSIAVAVAARCTLVRRPLHSPGAPPLRAGLGPDGIALFMTMMKGEFGLRFSGATGPVEYWVIDRIEQPSEN